MESSLQLYLIHKLIQGEVTIVKAGDPRRGQVGYIRKRDSIKRPVSVQRQAAPHTSFSD